MTDLTDDVLNDLKAAMLAVESRRGSLVRWPVVANPTGGSVDTGWVEVDRVWSAVTGLSSYPLVTQPGEDDGSAVDSAVDGAPESTPGEESQMRTYMGVDASSTRLVAVTISEYVAEDLKDHPRIQIDVHQLKVHDDHERCRNAAIWFRGVLYHRSPNMVCLEAPFIHPRHPQGAVGVIQVNGALLASSEGRALVSVPPSKWKGAILGKGDASKDEIVAWAGSTDKQFVSRVVLEYPKTVQQDIVDAYCIALYARRVHKLRRKAGRINVVRSAPRSRAKTGAGETEPVNTEPVNTAHMDTAYTDTVSDHTPGEHHGR